MRGPLLFHIKNKQIYFKLIFRYCLYNIIKGIITNIALSYGGINA
jgi:hypothetical protein